MGRLLDALLSDAGMAPAAIPAIPAIPDRPPLVRIAESQESQGGSVCGHESAPARIAESQESHGCEVPRIAPEQSAEREVAAARVDRAEQSARLLTAIRSECLPDDLLGRDTATPEQLADLSDSDLRAYALDLFEQTEREAGRVPPRWTFTAHCALCGPVYLLPGYGARVGNCAWCWNRLAHKPIPRPPVHCGDCRHFVRGPINPAEGGGDCCAEGVEYRSGSGPWPNVTRRCALHRPLDDDDGEA